MRIGIGRICWGEGGDSDREGRRKGEREERDRE